ncbi:MAG: glycosyltransferase, partial [Pseudomonadota bacterium]
EHVPAEVRLSESNYPGSSPGSSGSPKEANSRRPMIDISFVIPCYNEGGFAALAVQNILDLGFNHNIEIIVVDDSSRDDTVSQILTIRDSSITFH